MEHHFVQVPNGLICRVSAKYLIHECQKKNDNLMYFSENQIKTIGVYMTKVIKINLFKVLDKILD